MNHDELGDRMKMYEGAEAQRRLVPLLPVVARIDGRRFSVFTRGLKRPYDPDLAKIMVAVTKELVDETSALLGYTQSDEITLVMYSDRSESQVYFDGRVQKMVSSLAAFASVHFNRLLIAHLPSKAMLFPTFDARVWNVPTLEEAANTVLWRELDATKNSIAMAARAYFSHAQLFSKNGKQMQEMLHGVGVNWNDYPDGFKRGTFVLRRAIERPFTTEELEALPPKHNARTNPNLVTRRVVTDVTTLPRLLSVANRVGALFRGEPPILLNQVAEPDPSMREIQNKWINEDLPEHNSAQEYEPGGTLPEPEEPPP